jgi:hypothetical protein
MEGLERKRVRESLVTFRSLRQHGVNGGPRKEERDLLLKHIDSEKNRSMSGEWI